MKHVTVVFEITDDEESEWLWKIFGKRGEKGERYGLRPIVLSLGDGVTGPHEVCDIVRNWGNEVLESHDDVCDIDEDVKKMQEIVFAHDEHVDKEHSTATPKKEKTCSTSNENVVS